MSHTPIFIFLAPFTFALLLPFFKKNRVVSQSLSVLALSLALFFSLKGLFEVAQGSIVVYKLGGWQPPFGIEWRMDRLSALFCVMVSSISLVVTLATGRTVETELPGGRLPYYMVLLLHVSGLIGILLTHDLFNLFVFLEVASLTGYALIASGNNTHGNLASFRYVLIGTVGASFYLLGVGFLYGATGTLNMSDLVIRLSIVEETRSVFMGFVLVFLGLAIKMGLFPFHGWLPDAYTHASNSATSLVAPIMTKVMIYSFVRIFFVVMDYPRITPYGFTQALLYLSALAVILGSTMTFLQNNFKRMLAYSSVSHIGLIMLGFALADLTAFRGAVFHIINHATMKACLFLIATSAFHQHGIQNIFDFSKMRGRMPYTGAALILCALSMIGIPPLAGFFSKWYILVGAVQSGQPWVVFVIIFSSLLTALYFFKIIEKVYFQKPKQIPEMAEGPIPLVLSTSLLSLALILLGCSAPFIWKFYQYVPS